MPRQLEETWLASEIKVQRPTERGKAQVWVEGGRGAGGVGS